MYKRQYLNSVAFVDSQIKDFVQSLKDQGRYDEALIMVTGDHGEEFYEHGSWFHSSSLEAEQISVPLLIKWPKGVTAPDLKSASHLDILPSLLDYFAESPDSFSHLPGKSLLSAESEERTQVIITSRTGVAGISMVWKRGEYTATFRWEEPWENRFPSVFHLDDISDSNGSLNLSEKEDWIAAVEKYFPDVQDRLFESLNEK